MIIDFTKMTIYELFALILAILALIIPLGQWIYKKWLIKPVLKHLPTGKVSLFTNKSGSYIQLDGVFEALNKPISIKNIRVKVIRKKDENALNLSWSVFNSPVNQRVVGALTTTTEIAHPFRIEANSIVCAFIEFADFFDSFGKTITPLYDNLICDAKNAKSLELSFDDARAKFCSLKSYSDTKQAIEKELFWEIGQYEIILEAEYEKTKAKFYYQFNVNAEDYDKIKHNIEETLIAPLKDCYNEKFAFQLAQVELRSN